MTNTLEIIGDTEPVPAHERAKFEIEISRSFVDNGPGKPFTYRETGFDAFTDNADGTITSDNNSPAVADAMVRLALSKGAEKFRPSGTDRFMENTEMAMIQIQADYDAKYPVEKQLEGYDLDNAIAAGATYDGRHGTEADNSLEQDGDLRQRRAEQASQAQQAAAEENEQQRKPDNTLAGTPSTDDAPDYAETERRLALARKVKNAYVIDGNRYLTRGDKPTEAFRDNGNSITSKLDDERTTANAIDLMASRGVKSIKVSGTKVYRRHAWMAAQQHGIEVAGYKPSEQDQALFQKQDNTATDTTNEPRQQATEQAKATPSAPSQAGQLTGNLAAHGAAPYRNDPNKNKSYYVTVRDSNGSDRTQWGVDLKQAVLTSGVEVGDNITLRKTDTKSVAVDDEHGETVNGKRASWVIDAPERAAIIAAARERDKATIIKVAGAVVASRVSDPSDVDKINDMISERVDSHVGPLPKVPIYKTERQAPTQQPVQQQEESAQPSI